MGTVARWTLWHLAILCITSFKLRVLPKEHRTRAVLYGVLLWITLLSGFRQWSSAETANSVGSAPKALHCCCAITLFYINITETTGIWWPSHNAKRPLWVGYGSVILRLVCLLYITSLGQFVADFYGIPLSYVPPGKHLPVVLTMDAFDCLVVWYRTPIQFPASLGAADCGTNLQLTSRDGAKRA